MIKNSIALAFLFFIGLCVCQGQINVSEEVKRNVQERIDNNVNVGIVIGVVDANGTRYFSFGVKSLQTNEPVDENSVFEIGSVTKTFTGILLADKVIKGKMKLDDPLQKYLPAGVTGPTRSGAGITLVHLSNHTSSLPRMPDNFNPTNPANPFADYSEKQMYDFLMHYTLPRDIGSQYDYSNFGAGLLGHILAANSNVTYEQLMIDVIAKPLGLQNTGVVLTPAMKKNLAMGHSDEKQVENWDLNSLAGAGGIRSTAVDMIKYLSANMGITKSKLDAAIQMSQKNTRPEGSIPKIGLGWHMTPAGQKEIVCHNGGTGGYRTFIGFVRGEKRGVVVLSNSNVGVDDIGIHLLNPDSPLKAPEKEITIDASVLEKYIGKYELAPGFILTVTRADQQLNVQATNQPQFPVFPKGDNVFFLKVVEAQLTFNPNSDGAIESVTLHQNGQTMTGKKL